VCLVFLDLLSLLIPGQGEMSVALLPPREDMLGSDVLYGDTNIRLQLATRRGLKTEAVALSALRRDSIDAVGGFLNCLGRGQVRGREIRKEGGREA